MGGGARRRGGRPRAPTGHARLAATAPRPSRSTTWALDTSAMCRGGGRCGRPSGGRARRGPGGTSTAGLGPKWPPWSRTGGRQGAGRRTARLGRPRAGGGCATTYSTPRPRGLEGAGPRGTAPRGGPGHRRCWPITGAGGGGGTPGWPGCTTITAGRGHAAIAGARASALAPGLILVLVLALPAP